MAQVDFMTIFLMLYLPWILSVLFGAMWIAFILLAPREIWTACRIKWSPRLVGFALFDDGNQGIIQAMTNVADKGIFANNKDEYVVVPTSMPIRDTPLKYEYTFDEKWTEEQKAEHMKAVDAANERLKLDAEIERVVSETAKKRHTLFGKPFYIGSCSTGLGANPAMLALMQGAVDKAVSPDQEGILNKFLNKVLGPVKRAPAKTSLVQLMTVDTLKQVLTKAYPPARLESIGKRHENRVRKKGAASLPGWLIVILLVVGVVALLGATGVIDFNAIGKMVLGGVKTG